MVQSYRYKKNINNQELSTKKTKQNTGVQWDETTQSVTLISNRIQLD